MASNVKLALEQINEVSRRLLSHVLAAQNKIQKNTTIMDEPSNDELITNHDLSELMTERQNLISCFFEQNIKAEIALEPDLLNEMASLDSELSSASIACKKALSEQVIRLKKGKKVTKSYQKY